VKRVSESSDVLLFEAALALAGGPSLVLDPSLRVRFVTRGAEELLGERVPVGTHAPSFLCGEKSERPVAEALVAGLPVHATLARLTSAGTTFVRVRGTPLVATGASVVGWLLSLAAVGGSAEDTEEELFHGLWTQDLAMKRLFRLVERVAADESSVLVRGETGSGKELVARAVHACSARRSGPFRAINCAALPANLLESELFGHVRGAFTGAMRDTPGHFQLAHKGTLFLDEVAEVPLELQAKLLRVLETHTITPVGGRDPIPVDVRIVSATHRSLRSDVAAGRFRADLMYRLRVIPVFLPPLRERLGDIPLLVDRIVDELNARSRRRIERVSPGAIHALRAYEWPGNVRELRNALAYAFAVGDGSDLLASHLPPEVLEGVEESRVVPPPPAPPSETVANPEAKRVLRALERSGGNRERAAKLLGMSRITLWRRIKELGLDAPRSAADLAAGGTTLERRRP
jgi:transcriptional regulator with PAS, ATPase and Fis domain